MTTFCDSDGDGVLEETVIPADGLNFPKAKRTYEAVEFTVEKSFSNDWSMQGSYTWSKNKGNTEGSVKSDNSQDMANLTTDFDLPQLMDGAYGYLPNDRRHKIKLWASYQATDHLMLGANLFAQSGRPINSFGEGHPDGAPLWGATYYLTTDVGDPDVLGDETFEFTPRGTAGRTDWITQINLSAIYSFNWGDTAEVELRADIFNLFDSDSADEVYEHYEIRPDQFKLPKSYQQPRYLRFGAAIRF
jgi:outer membrane receptor for monomeric catechols